MCPFALRCARRGPKRLSSAPCPHSSTGQPAVRPGAVSPKSAQAHQPLRVEQNSWAGGALGAPGCWGAHVGTQKSSRGAPWIAVRVAAVVGVGLSQLRPGAADLAGGSAAPRLSCRHLGAGALNCRGHRARGSRRCYLPSSSASKPPQRARPRSALSLRWRPPLGPWRSTSRSWSSTLPQTSNSKVGRKKAAPD